MPSTLDGNGYERHLGLDGHDDAALLEGEQLAGLASRTLRKNQKGRAGTQRSDSARDRCHRPVTIAAFDRNESAYIKDGADERKSKLGFVQDVQLWMESLEQDRRVDVAFVVRTEDDGAVG